MRKSEKTVTHSSTCRCLLSQILLIYTAIHFFKVFLNYLNKYTYLVSCLVVNSILVTVFLDFSLIFSVFSIFCHDKSILGRQLGLSIGSYLQKSLIPQYQSRQQSGDKSGDSVLARSFSNWLTTYTKCTWSALIWAKG